MLDDFKNEIKSLLYEKTKKEIRIGVCGYSDKKFDKELAKKYIKEAFDEAADGFTKVTIISGLTNLGIPALAYKEAEKRGYCTEGVACKKAEEFECFNCDVKIILGEEWGDESETFLKDLDVLIRIGGGKQSKEETKKAKEMKIKVLEYDLEEIK